jgi:hypothetical protein
MPRRECTNGAWPCEMSTHLAALEAENYRLKSLLADVKEQDINQFTKSGKWWFDEDTRKRIHEAL